MNKENQKLSRIKHAVIFYYLFLVLGLIIIFRIGYIQFHDGKVLREKASRRSIFEKIIEADRGNIYSIDGKVMATSVPYFDIYVDFSEKTVKQVDFDNYHDSLAWYLSRHFPSKSYKEYKHILREYRRKQVRYGLLLRKINYHQLKLVRNFPLFRLGRYRGGIIVEKRNERVYPFGLHAKRTIGYVRGREKVGIEGAYDAYLAGTNGRQLKHRLPGGIYIPLDDDFIIKPKNGVDVVLAIDTRIQDVAQNALLEHLIYHDADWGCAVLMEVKTGEVRAIANLEKTTDGNYREIFNHAIGTLYEPGSTFKLFPMMVMLEDNLLDLNEIVNTGNGRLKLVKWEVLDQHPMGKITASQVFEFSSNVGIIMLVMNRYKNNPKKFIQKLIDIKLNSPMNLDILGEKGAIIPLPGTKNWSSISLLTMAYGYGVMITPLQLLAYYNAVVNDGRLMRPMFVLEIRQHGNVIEKFKPVVLHEQICSPKVSKKLRQMMEGVVQNGTAQNLKNVSLKIAGKTGTSRIWDAQQKKYSDTYYNASFVGYFPAENPKYSCIVVIHKPRKGYYYGSNVAGPVFRDIAEVVYATDLELHNSKDQNQKKNYELLTTVNKIYKSSLRNLKNLYSNELIIEENKNDSWYDIEADSCLRLKCSVINEFRDIPNVKGMKMREAVFLLNSLGYDVKALGYGQVFEQTIINIPGRNKATIELVLRPK